MRTCHQEGSDESFKFLDQSLALFRTEIRTGDQALCGLENQRRGLRTAEADRFSEMQACFLEHLERILEGVLVQGTGIE